VGRSGAAMRVLSRLRCVSCHVCPVTSVLSRRGGPVRGCDACPVTSRVTSQSIEPPDIGFAVRVFYPLSFIPSWSLMSLFGSDLDGRTDQPAESQSSMW
jgi:hypothetical protein